MRPFLNLLLIAVAVATAACGSQRHYRLELEPVPAGATRKITGTLRVGDHDEVLQGTLPMVREWTSTSLSGELTSPGNGGMRLSLSARPSHSVERIIQSQAEGPYGVRSRIIERTGADTWGVEVQVVPLEPPLSAAADATP